jgi:voltage-gated potassium channel Kch
MQKASFSDRLRYATDNTFSKGPVVLIGWLALVTAILITGIAFLVWATRLAPGLGLLELIWMGLMRTLDSGTMGGDTGSWPFLLAMLAVTLTGIFVLSILIGLLTTGIEARLDALRKGRSRVIEENHTVILGWSEQIFPIISELVLANENQKNPCIVVLAPKDKVEMEDEIREKVSDSRRTRIVCRTGTPMEMADLEIASLNTSRSIIVLSPEDDNADAEVIKILLAITNAPNRRQQPYTIVAELRDGRNLDVARMVGKDEVELILFDNLIARIIAQTCRQSGLSIVYTELLDFGGDEIYFKEEAALVGKSFGEAQLAYETSTIMGIQPQGKTPVLNPPADQRINAGDRLIAIAADDDQITLSRHSDIPMQKDAIRAATPAPAAPERALILGWNDRAPAIINELDNYVAPGSLVTLVADYAEGEAELAERCGELRNQTVEFHFGDTTDRRLLDSLDIASYDHIITLSYSGLMAPQQADARTLITLLHLRDMAERRGRNFSIVSEMLDSRNRTLAETTQADDFIVSDRLISLMLSQVSENKELNAVFADLFDPEGAEIYLKPASAYVQTGVAVNFYTVVEAARRRNEVALGYRLLRDSGNREKSYGVKVNPNKAATVTFRDEDMLILIADE